MTHNKSLKYAPATKGPSAEHFTAGSNVYFMLMTWLSIALIEKVIWLSHKSIAKVEHMKVKRNNAGQN